jgi:hypothetical protein
MKRRLPLEVEDRKCLGRQADFLTDVRQGLNAPAFIWSIYYWTGVVGHGSSARSYMVHNRYFADMLVEVTR